MQAQRQQQQEEYHDWRSYNELSVGEILRRARMQYGQSIEDVAVNLNIRSVQLNAIEDGHIEKLPGRVYAIGYVRSYAEYLGLDGDKIVHLFKNQSGVKGKTPLSFPVPASESKLPNKYIISGSVLFIIAIMALWAVLSPPNPVADRSVPDLAASVDASHAAEELPLVLGQDVSVAPEGGRAALQKQGGANLVAAKKSSGVPASQSRLSVHAVAESWVKIETSEGQVLFSKTLAAGETYNVPDQKGLWLSTGNAGGLEMRLDGTVVPLPGSGKDVRRDILLEPESFNVE